MSQTHISPAQLQALFDILTHYETYSEIEDFKWPSPINSYGHPFKKEIDAKTTSPVLQVLLCKFVLNTPGIKGVTPELWHERIQGLVTKLGEAELSESYDKGAMGVRKTLATAYAVVFENIARGSLGGCPIDPASDRDRPYDMSNPKDLMRAWDTAIQGCLYGDLIDELAEQLLQTGTVEDHSPMAKAACEYIIIIMASFMHYIFVLSPDGQYLVQLIKNAHRLTPYAMIKQTLYVGNAATMINGMMKLLLTKLSMNGLTSSLGIGKPSDKGMNLLQEILSRVLSWDEADFKEHASAIEHDKNGPSKEHLKAIKSFIQEPRATHEKIRKISMEQSKSMVTVILNFYNPDLVYSISESQHTQLLEYYAAHLSIRDRQEISKVFCSQTPDLFTQAIRDVIATAEPLIRSVHNAVNLSASVTDAQHFIDDLIVLSKHKKTENSTKDAPEYIPPSVEDYVKLLHKHKASLFSFYRQVLKNDPEVAGIFIAYAKDLLAEFRHPPAYDSIETKDKTTENTGNGAGSMSDILTAIFSQLSPADQSTVLKSVDAHSAYLNSLNGFSTAKMDAVVANTSSTMHGPGMYLPRWQSLLDETLITPAFLGTNPVRRGKDVKYKRGKGLNQKAKKEWKSTVSPQQVLGEVPEAPDVTIVRTKLGKQFKEILRNMEVKA